MRYKSIVRFVFMLWTLPVLSQTDVQLSQHMFNRMNYNPAVTGASRYVNITGYVRDQWTGWEGAPTTRMLTLHNYFTSIRSGLGIVFVYDAIGLEKSINTKVNYAYHVVLTEDSYLSLGLGAGVLHRFFDRTHLTPDQENDQNLPADINDRTYADFDFGMEYNYRNFRAGASVTHLTRSAKSSSPLGAGRHFYGFLQYRHPVNFRWEIQPSWFIQENRKFIHSEVNMLAFYDNRFWFGMSFRVDRTFQAESLVPMGGVNIGKTCSLGYSYDVNLGKLHSYSEGTHEINLRIRLRKDSRQVFRSPRFFE